MADVSGVTAIRPTDNTRETNVTYGATVSVFSWVYKDAADSEYKLADNNNGLALSKVEGVCVTPGVDGGNGYIVTSGKIVIVGTTLTKGAIYVLSDTAGNIRPATDTVTTGEYLTIVGYAESTTELVIDIANTETTHP